MCFSLYLQLYELDNDPQRKEFLDELFVFMQKRGNFHSMFLSDQTICSIKTSLVKHFLK